MMQFLLGLFKGKSPKDKPESASLKKQMKETKEGFSTRLRAGDAKTWHHIYMGAVITMTGLLGIFAVFANSLLDSQKEAMESRPAVLETANATLPEGNYRILQMVDGDRDTPMFLVAPKEGGVLVSVYPPDGSIPADMTAERAAKSTLMVQPDGRWVFQTP